MSLTLNSVHSLCLRAIYSRALCRQQLNGSLNSAKMSWPRGIGKVCNKRFCALQIRGYYTVATFISLPGPLLYSEERPLPMIKMYMCDVCIVFERTSRVVNQFKNCLLAFE